MVNYHRQLKNARRQSHLTHADMDSLLGLRSSYNLSKYESGQRKWSLELIALYRMCFDVGYEKIFPPIEENLKVKLLENLFKRIQALQREPPTPMIKRRLNFLQKTLLKLNQ